MTSALLVGNSMMVEEILFCLSKEWEMFQNMLLSVFGPTLVKKKSLNVLAIRLGSLKTLSC